jgi:hypothetical protein
MLRSGVLPIDQHARRVGDIAASPAETTNPLPLISCLMVTRASPERLERLQRSVTSFLEQNYAQKELIIMCDGPSAPAQALADYVSEIGDPRLQCVHVEGTHTLGALRNRSIQIAQGAYVCQWDDDDLSHPMRLDIQSLPLRKGEADACYLEDVLHWFEDQHELYWISFRAWRLGVHPGTGMVRRDVVLGHRLAYPETGPEAARGEDGHFLFQLKAAARVQAVSEMPELYVYTFHGQNTWERAHHEKLVRKFGVPAERVRDALPRLRPLLGALPFAQPVALRAEGDTIFEVTPGADVAGTDVEVRLDGLRALVVRPSEASWLEARSEMLRAGFERLGASEIQVIAIAPGEDAVRTVARVAREFRPSLILDLGVPDITECAHVLEAPILLLRSAWDPLPLPGASPPGSATALLWLDRAELAEALPEVLLPAELLEPLVGAEHSTRDAVSRVSVAVCGIDAPLRQQLAQFAELVPIAPGERPPNGVLAAILGPGVAPYAAAAMGIPVLGFHHGGTASRLWDQWEQHGFGKGFAHGDTVGLCAHVRATTSAASAGPTAPHAVTPGDPDAPLRRLAALLIQIRALRQSGTKQGPPPGAFLAASLGQVAEELAAETSLHAMSTDAVRRALEQGEWLGMPVWSTESGKVYDVHQSWNWMNYHVNEFFEADWRGHLASRERAGLRAGQLAERKCCAALGETPVQVRVRPQRYAITLEWALDLSGLDTGRVRLFLPFPLASHASHADVSVVRTWPGEFADRLIPECGYFYGVDLDAAPNLRVGYEARVTNVEIHTHGLSRPDPSPWRELGLGQLLEALAAAPLTSQEKAWLLYEHMVREGRYERRAHRCLCASCATQAFSTQGTGSCSLFASAFLGYCQHLGIEGRLVRGAMLGYPMANQPDRFESTVPRHSPGHSWVELNLEGIGWIPVDFQQCTMNPRGLASRKTGDPELRQEIARQFETLLPFYFGNIDNQRLVWSQSNQTMPTACYFDATRPLGQRWVILDGPRLRSRLEFRYL